ncbi:MAG: hypothetical protein SGJ11_05140 [Phycisphaerae bacterium]|nr:hypothetical protein [Phycisphaerae bacterium]
MTNSVSGPPAVAAQYRFRTDTVVSTWMTAEQLKEAALRGELTLHSHIQQVGHADWVAATNVRGLTFPEVHGIAIAAEPPPPAPVAEPVHNGVTASGPGGSARHPKFATLREVLGAYLNADIEINVPDASEHGLARVVAIGHDHFELTLESDRNRVFIPYAQIRAIWSCETSSSATLTYREAHKLTVDVERARK